MKLPQQQCHCSFEWQRLPRNLCREACCLSTQLYSSPPEKNVWSCASSPFGEGLFIPMRHTSGSTTARLQAQACTRSPSDSPWLHSWHRHLCRVRNNYVWALRLVLSVRYITHGSSICKSRRDCSIFSPTTAAFGAVTECGYFKRWWFDRKDNNTFILNRSSRAWSFKNKF